MDKARDPEILKRRQRRRWALGGAALVVLALGGVAVSRLQPAPPTVDGSSVYADRVQQGTMVRQVRGIGTLVPVEVRTIPALTEGRVEAIPVQPGAAVTASTVLVRLANPTVVKALADAQAQLAGAQADLANLKATLQAAQLDAQSIGRRMGPGSRTGRGRVRESSTGGSDVRRCMMGGGGKKRGCTRGRGAGSLRRATGRGRITG